MSSANAAALPALWEYAAPTAWKSIDFISDLHLAHDTPRTFSAWAEHMTHTPADAVFILGDLFEAWVGDDSRSSGFERECADVLAQSARHRTLAFMVGNRDFLVDAAMLDECRVLALPDPTVLTAFGQRLLLSHGDALCLADVDYQNYRAEVRSDVWRERFLAMPLAQRRAIARQLRDASEARKHQIPLHEWADVDAAEAVRWMQAGRAPVLIHGHTHRPGTNALARGFVRHVLSDWDLEQPAGRAQVLRLSAAGLSRVVPSTAAAR
jgi:UDP-2,3-diacylglucosamine hydrolase